ncbi:hypothetical protein BDR06DRAFT_898589, partial [Suillus hirtellus]
LSSIQITVKHAFNALKGCFPSLKDLPPEQNIQDSYHLMQALFALQNLCIDLGYHLEQIPSFDPSDPDRNDSDEGAPHDVNDLDFDGAIPDGQVELPAYETNEWLWEAGYHCHLLIMNDLFPLD